jgi:hypothetical protein
MQLMSEPWVTRVTVQGNQLLLTVQVDEFLPNEPIEISGYVTQHGGAIATVYDIQAVTKNPDGTATMYVNAAPAQGFQDGYDVTIVLRAARVWVTVLKQPGPTPSEPTRLQAGDGTVWNNLRAAGQATPGGSPTWTVEGTPAGGDSSFHTG